MRMQQDVQLKVSSWTEAVPKKVEGAKSGRQIGNVERSKGIEVHLAQCDDVEYREKTHEKMQKEGAGRRKWRRSSTEKPR